MPHSRGIARHRFLPHRSPFFLDLLLAISLSLSRRHRSTWSISSSEIDLPLLPLAGRSLLVNTRDISSRISLFPRGGEERVDLARDSLSPPLFARSRAFFYSQVKNKRRILRYFDDNSSVEKEIERERCSTRIARDRESGTERTERINKGRALERGSRGGE